MTTTKREDVLDGIGGHALGPWTIERPKPSERHVIGHEEGHSWPVLVAACETDEDAELIARAPALVDEIRELREAVRELERGAMYATDMLMSEPTDEGATRLIGDRVIIHRSTWDALRTLLPDPPRTEGEG